MSLGLYPLAGKQLRSAQLADHRLNVWDGAVRSGKTIAADFAWLRFVRRGPAGNLLMAGKTERTLKRNVIDPLIDILGSSQCRYMQGSGELWLLGRRIYLAGANDERAQERIRGLTLVGAYVDEASTVPESFWTMLLSRLSVEGARLFGTTNPDAPAHWLKRRYLDRARLHVTGDGGELRCENALDLARFSFRLPDNPHLPSSYVEAINAEYVGLWYRRFILGEWVAAEGAIYDMFDLARHLVAELPPMQTWWLGIDYGTANPLHALLLGLGVDDRLYVAREWRWDSRAKRRQLTDAEYSTHLRDWLYAGAEGVFLINGKPAAPPIKAVILDPSAASFRAQLKRDGWGMPSDADNAVLDGIRDVATLLGADRLRLHASTAHLQRELSSYVWDPKAQERGEDAPLKVDDHGADALRYLCHTWSVRRHWRHWVATRIEEAA